MFGKKKTTPSQQYDPAHYRAVIRCSICTREQVAGFKKKLVAYYEGEDISILRDFLKKNCWKTFYHHKQ